MTLKAIILVVVFSLTACSNTEQPNESEQTSQPGETVIELESNEDENESVNFNKNSRIDSEIYKEFFFTKDLLEKDRMESDVIGDNKIANGNQLPIGTENLSTPYYMDYTFNMSEEKLDLALILAEGTIVKEEELAEDVFVHLEYDNKNDTLINIIQENTSGETIDHVDLTEEEWIEVAERSIEFVDIIH